MSTIRRILRDVNDEAPLASGEFFHFTAAGAEFRVAFPVKKEVCYRCRGKGVHVNPAIDGHGISPEEFADDPDFAESYFRGDYDVSCERCNGDRVIDTVDRRRLTKFQTVLYSAICEAEHYARLERQSEIRFGY